MSDQNLTSRQKIALEFLEVAAKRSQQALQAEMEVFQLAIIHGVPPEMLVDRVSAGLGLGICAVIDSHERREEEEPWVSSQTM